MKKVTALLLAVIMLTTCMLTACNTDKPKTGKERLCEYVLKNGENIDGTYKTTQLFDDGKFVILCNSENELTFSNLKEMEYGNFSSELVFALNSTTQDVTFKFEVDTYVCEAKGTIKTNEVTSDICEISGITFTHNFPDGSTPSADEIVNTMFSPTVKLMLSQLNLTLQKDTDVSMSELGFTNWENS